MLREPKTVDNWLKTVDKCPKLGITLLRYPFLLLLPNQQTAPTYRVDYKGFSYPLCLVLKKSPSPTTNLNLPLSLTYPQSFHTPLNKPYANTIQGIALFIPTPPTARTILGLEPAIHRPHRTYYDYYLNIISKVKFISLP